MVLIERLKLPVLKLADGRLQIDELHPIDVWEKTQAGLFDRSEIVSEVETWVSRIDMVYQTIEGWFGTREDLRFDKIRNIIMSEEPMQLFAVTDLNLPILDVLRGEEIITSFVPRGLWLIGAWGRVDVITTTSTAAIVGIRDNPHDDNTFNWRLSRQEKRRQLEPLTKEALLSIVTPQ